ncbi:MAG: hypothetical protein ACP5UZ_08445 [Thermoplasmata archaeon]
MHSSYHVEAETIWNSYIIEASKPLYGIRWQTFQDLFPVTTVLLWEATRCYANALPNATVVMCRGVVDASIFEYLQLQIILVRSDKGDIVPVYSIRRDRITNKNGKYLENWKEIKLAIEKSDMFMTDEWKVKLNEIESLRDKGNFAAHLFPRSQKEADIATRLLLVVTWVKDGVDISNIKKWGYTDEDIQSARQILEKDKTGTNITYKRFTTIEEAGDTLKHTTSFVLDIQSKFKRKQDRHLNGLKNNR